VAVTPIKMGPAWIADVLPGELAAEVRTCQIAALGALGCPNESLIAQHRFLDRGGSILFQ